MEPGLRIQEPCASSFLEAIGDRANLQNVVNSLKSRSSCKRLCPSNSDVMVSERPCKRPALGILSQGSVCNMKAWPPLEHYSRCLFVPIITTLVQGGQRVCCCVRFIHRDVEKPKHSDVIQDLLVHSCSEGLRRARTWYDPAGTVYAFPHCHLNVVSHKMKMEPTCCRSIFQKECCSDCPAMFLGDQRSLRHGLLKVYQGMRQPGDPPCLSSHLFVSYDHRLTGCVLRALFDLFPCSSIGAELKPRVLIKQEPADPPSMTGPGSLSFFQRQMHEGFGKPLQFEVWDRSDPSVHCQTENSSSFYKGLCTGHSVR